MPKFKVGDMIKCYNKNTNRIFVEQIVEITSNIYKIKGINFPIQDFGNESYMYINCELFETETISFTQPVLLTDEDKLKLL